MDTPEELSDEQCDAIAREVLLMLSRLPVDGEDGWSDRALIRAGYRRASERPTVAPDARQLLRDWCAQVDNVGTGWDDWSHCYKAANKYLRDTPEGASGGSLADVKSWSREGAEANPAIAHRGCAPASVTAPIREQCHGSPVEARDTPRDAQTSQARGPTTERPTLPMWISVATPPENEERVLWLVRGRVEVGRKTWQQGWNPDRIVLESGHNIAWERKDATHWMPLPDAAPTGDTP